MLDRLRYKFEVNVCIPSVKRKHTDDKACNGEERDLADGYLRRTKHRS